MTDRELMQQALDALDLLARYENPATKVQVRKPRDGGPIVTMYPHKVATEAAVPLRARLAQPEPEPVAWDPKIERLYDKNGFLLHQKIKRTPSSEWEDYYPQPESEPVAWMYNGNLHEFDPSDWAEGEVIPLYTAPPQREWQGLTDEELNLLWVDYHGNSCLADGRILNYERAIEAKLREKNA